MERRNSKLQSGLKNGSEFILLLASILSSSLYMKSAPGFLLISCVTSKSALGHKKSSWSSSATYSPFASSKAEFDARQIWPLLPWKTYWIRLSFSANFLIISRTLGSVEWSSAIQSCQLSYDCASTELMQASR